MLLPPQTEILWQAAHPMLPIARNGVTPCSSQLGVPSSALRARGVTAPATPAHVHLTKAFKTVGSTSLMRIKTRFVDLPMGPNTALSQAMALKGHRRAA